MLTGWGAACADEADSVAAGERIFKMRCLSCHETTEVRNKLGPHLVGILGRTAGAVEGARYSKAMRESDRIWDTKTLDAYLANPRKALPGTTKVMALTRAEDRTAIIAYFNSLQPDYDEE